MESGIVGLETGVNDAATALEVRRDGGVYGDVTVFFEVSLVSADSQSRNGPAPQL